MLNETLFKLVMANTSHALHSRLSDHVDKLKHRRHDRKLPIMTTQISESVFVVEMLALQHKFL